MLPDGKDIHSVINAGDSVAISIHVYGADLNKLGSSINRRFDHLPIRGTAPTAL
jgi:predicted metal-dependent enzyme (double-stranded beta helix superfamily)